MSFRRFENADEQAFRRDALERIEESRGLWATFVSTRPLHLVQVPSRLPAFQGKIESTCSPISRVQGGELSPYR